MVEDENKDDGKKRFCIDCERKIQSSMIGGFGSTQGEEFKDGWRCGKCAEKK